MFLIFFYSQNEVRLRPFLWPFIKDILALLKWCQIWVEGDLCKGKSLPQEGAEQPDL